MCDSMQEFLFKYGTDTTTNFDLKKIAKDLNLKIKILMRNEVTPSINNNKSIIMNLETTKQDGSHWVAFYQRSRAKFYFDPYGILPPKNITYKFGQVMYNTLQIQPDGTRMCGQLCLWVLYQLSLEESFDNIILSMYEEIQDLIE
jgi:hypothetical protein